MTVCLAAWPSPFAACAKRCSYKVAASPVPIWFAFCRTISATSVKEFCSYPMVSQKFSKALYLYDDLLS